MRSTRIVATTLALWALCALLLGCSAASPVSEPEPEPKPTATVALDSALASASLTLDDSLVIDGIDRWFDAYVNSRVIEVQLNDREAVAFGPWAAAYEPGTEDAAADGSLTEWADDYYITHEWSDYGQQILSMQPGDVVEVNGRAVVVERVFNYPKQSFYEEVMRVVAGDAVVLQTCYPNSDQNRIVCGT